MNSLSHSQLDALLSAAQVSVRDTLLISLAVEHGLRASEACSLRVRDFDTSTATVYLTVQRLKHSKKTRQRLLQKTQASVLA